MTRQNDEQRYAEEHNLDVTPENVDVAPPPATVPETVDPNVNPHEVRKQESTDADAEASEAEAEQPTQPRTAKASRQSSSQTDDGENKGS